MEDRSSTTTRLFLSSSLFLLLLLFWASSSFEHYYYYSSLLVFVSLLFLMPLLLLLLILVACDDDDTKKTKPSSYSFPPSDFFLWLLAAKKKEEEKEFHSFSLSPNKRKPNNRTAFHLRVVGLQTHTYFNTRWYISSTHLNTHADYLLLYPERMSALSLSTPIVTNARVSSTRRTRVSSIKASCSKSPSSSKSSITLQGAPLKGLKMATQRNQYSVLMQTPPSRGTLQVWVFRVFLYCSSNARASFHRKKTTRVAHVFVFFFLFLFVSFVAAVSFFCKRQEEENWNIERRK